MSDRASSQSGNPDSNHVRDRVTYAVSNYISNPHIFP